MNKQLSDFLTEAGISLEINFHGYSRRTENEPAGWYWRARYLSASGKAVGHKRKLSDPVMDFEFPGWGTTPDSALYSLVVGSSGHWFWSDNLRQFVEAPDFSTMTRGNFVTKSLQSHLDALEFPQDKRLHLAASMGLSWWSGVGPALIEGINKELRDVGKKEMSLEEVSVLEGIVERMSGTDSGDLRADFLGVAAGAVSRILTQLQFEKEENERNSR